MTRPLSGRIGLALLTSTALLTAAPAAFAQDDTADRSSWDEIVVTASPLGRTVVETILGTTVLDEEALAQRVDATIGETLRREPGVSSTFFGPGASRPIVRGLGGPRLAVLDAGIGTIDASVTSVDHAVAIEPVLANRIEVVRGTGMLLYGSSAAGGVVNIFDGRIPDAVPEGGFDIAARYGYGTVDESNEIAGGVTATVAEFGDTSLVLHGDGFWREADDYEIPGFAESAAFRAAEEDEEHDDDHGDEDHDDDHEDEEEAFGILENSDYETKGGSAGFSFVFPNGFFGAAVKFTDSNYGIPGGHEHGHEEEEGEEHDEDHEEEEEEEELVRIDLEQTRYDVMGEINGDFGFFKTARIRAGYADYEHTELEGDEVGTVFTNEGWEGRLELVQKDYGALTGAVGAQITTSDFSAIGEEAFVPPTESVQFGLFTVQNYDLGQWNLEAGARYEHTNREITETGTERTFDTISLSGGAGFKPMKDIFLGATVFRTERAPSTEELFSNGPHLATNAFEIGDPDLDKEVALGIEATARGRFGNIFGQVNVFHTSYSDFIYETETAEEEDGLPVFLFLADDATFTGFEILAEAIVATASFDYVGDVDFYADAAVDYVNATLDVSGNDNLPRIPPLSGIFGLGVRSSHVDLRAELEYAGEQDDVTVFELPTEDYALFNLYATLRPFGKERNIAVDIRALNLTDEEARLHTSFLKDEVPLPGRNVKLSVRAAF